MVFAPACFFFKCSYHCYPEGVLIHNTLGTQPSLLSLARFMCSERLSSVGFLCFMAIHSRFSSLHFVNSFYTIVSSSCLLDMTADIGLVYGN